MRAYILSGMICIACSSFQGKTSSTCFTQYIKARVWPVKPNVFDVTVHRLSGDRVMISWHAEGESEQTRFEVMRKHGREIFTSVGVVEPRQGQDNLADFSYVDANAFEDSSFYCVKKTQPDSVVFFSITRGVEGVGRRLAD